MVDIRNISLKVNGKFILKDVNLKINDGECLALLGPNGAGKSSLIDIFTGAIRPSHGEVKIWGKEFQEVKKDIGVLYEYSPLFYYSKVKEILAYVCVIYGIKYKSIAELIRSLGMQNIEDRLVRVLSKGERRKVGIILALLHNPSLLILDEPTSGMDPFVRDHCWNLFKKAGRTILFSTHIWEEAEKYADRIAFISEGEILEVDTPSAFLSNKYLKTRKKVTLSKDEKLAPLFKETLCIEENGQCYLYPADIDQFLETVKEKAKDYSISPIALKDVFLYIRTR